MKKRGFGVVALALCGILLVSSNTTNLTVRAAGVAPKITWLSKNYSEIKDFSEGMAAVEFNNDKWGFIDKTGKEVIAAKYDYVESFSGGLALVRIFDKGERWGYIDKAGKEVTAFKYQYTGSFNEGLAPVKIEGKWGYIDRTGNAVIETKYDVAGEFNDGIAIVGTNTYTSAGSIFVDIHTTYSLIDTQGKEIIAMKYEEVSSFTDGLALVKLSGKYGYIDKTGKLVIPLKYNYAEPFSEGRAAVGVQPSKGSQYNYGYIDTTGKEVIPLKYGQAESFSEGLAVVGFRNSQGYVSQVGCIDKTGKVVLPIKYLYMQSFSEGIARISVEARDKEGYRVEKACYMDKKGNIVIPIGDYRGHSPSKDGVVLVDGDNKQGIIINPLIKIVTPTIPTPKISIVSLEHVPFVEGDNNEFYISAKGYTGQVQYQLFYIQESVMKEWKLINNADMINGWTNPIDAQAPINVDISSLNLKADKYRFAIRVRRVGVKGLKQNSYGDYDDAYPFNLDVVKNADIKLSDNINIEKTNFTKSENLVISGVGNLSKDIQYKLHLFDVKNSKWLTDLTEYNTDVNYSLKNIPEGTYIVDLWARNINSNTKYDGWKLKLVTVSEVIPISLNKTTSSLIVGGEDKLTAIINTIESTSKSVTWTSSNDTIAKVDDTGKVTALKIGTATITATTADKTLKATCKVTVSAIDIADNTDITSKFTDVNFKTIVYELIGKANPAPILYSDVKNIPQLEIDKRNISSLSGIEYFTALTWLRCGNNQLTNLDVSKNAALDSLECPSNQLTTLDVSENTALRSLYCADNRLTTLDVSKNTALIDLSCSRNQLTTLDVSKNAALVQLFCASNQLTTLDVSKNTALTFLYCPMNPLTTLDVSKNIALTDLGCSSEQLTTLDVSKNTALTRLLCSSTQLTTLDVSRNIALTELNCPDSQLTTLDVSKNTALTKLNCSNNQLTTLEVSKNIALTELNCYGNQLTTLDVSKNTVLTKLNCSNNQLTALEVSKNTESTNFDYKAQFIDSTHTTSTWDLIKIIKK